MTDDGRPIRKIDDAFWEEWLACENQLLRYAFRFTKNETRALELRDKAFDQTINGERPWRVGTTVEDHMKGCMRSINWNAGVSQSELVLRKEKKDKDPNPAAEGRSPEEEAIDNEESAILQEIGRIQLERARKGSLEQRVLREVAAGVEDLHDVADRLGVTVAQVWDVQKVLRRKAREIRDELGYALGERDEEDDGDES